MSEHTEPGSAGTKKAAAATKLSSRSDFSVKARVTGELGESFDAHLEKAQAEVEQARGGRQALRGASEALRKLHEHIDKDREQGKLAEELKETDPELVAARYAKLYVTRAIEALLNLANKSDSAMLVASGKVAAARSALELVQRHHTSAVVRTKQLELSELEAAQEAADDSGDEDTSDGPRGRQRRPGERPGSSKLDGRRKAARKKKTAKKAAKKTTKKRAKSAGKG